MSRWPAAATMAARIAASCTIATLYTALSAPIHLERVLHLTVDQHTRITRDANEAIQVLALTIHGDARCHHHTEGAVSTS